MCGIGGVAYAHPEHPVSPDMLRNMLSSIRHRGPDSTGFHIAPGIGLGIQRLSIIDLQTGDQPLSNEDETVKLVCNGEIYNYTELRHALLMKGHRFRTHSDCEVIVHLYEEYGVECVQYLRGMFAFALWDARERRLMLARDRFGIKPLHYAVTTDGLFFGSESKAILASEQIERALNVQALDDVFTIGFVLTPKTFFRAIHRLPHAHYLLYQGGTVSLHRYWEAHFPVLGEDVPPLSPHQWAERVREKLEESVHLHLRSDVPVGAWLSPGLDSSAVTAFMHRLLDRPVQTFTLAFADPTVDEVRHHKLLSEFPSYRLQNHQFRCTVDDIACLPQAMWHGEDPHTGGTDISRLLLAKLSAGSLKVVLTGEGSDEVFGGYPWFKFHKLAHPLLKLPITIRRLLAIPLGLRNKWQYASEVLKTSDPFSLVGYKSLIGLSASVRSESIFSEELRQRLQHEGGTTDSFRLPQDFPQWQPFNRLQYVEMNTRLPDYIVRYLDTASMAHSLEVRVPFLDHEFVELCAQIPVNLKMRRLEEKYILRRAMDRILPVDIVHRRKRGLTAPSRQWLDALPDFARELLSEEQVRHKGYFDPDKIKRMLQQHWAHKRNYERTLMSVLKVQLWDDLFLRRRQFSV